MRILRQLKKIPQLVEFEEHVGRFWHGFISKRVNQHYPEAAVYLQEVQRSVQILFRAMGGDGGLKLEAAFATGYKTRRSLLQRIASSQSEVELAWRDAQALHLPYCLDVFPQRELNRDLYLWLAALASADTGHFDEDDAQQHWFRHNQWLSCQVLHRYPGLAERYTRLVEAHLEQRPAIENLAGEDVAQERAIRAALRSPGQSNVYPATTELPQAVYLWLHPCPPRSSFTTSKQDPDAATEAGGEVIDPEQQRQYKAEQVEMPDGDRGLVLDRFENIFSWAEYIKVDRTTEEDEDLASAEDSARDLDQLSVARDQRAVAKRIRFDLDLPSAEHDDAVLEAGILIPEWDYRRSHLVDDHCCIQPMQARDVTSTGLPVHLRATARRIRGQFESLLPRRIWLRAQADGSEIDMESYLHFQAERCRGRAVAEQGMYRDFRGAQRDMACLLLADLSLSTDAWINNEARIIDVIHDSLMLFSEALSASGDQFAMYGFSSRHREHVRFHTLKEFNEPYNGITRGRIAAIKPGFYTRMGAAIRYASDLLSQQAATQPLLLILTDGKPNDLDLYEGRYGIEDTRMAIIEARRKGLKPFCVTIDEKAGDYLPYIFGNDSYVMIRKPSELPRELPLLYAGLTH